MRGFDPKTSFGEEEARGYDASSVRGDEAETVRFLAEQAGGAGALEFAIGTGRIGLPLAAAGVPVEGIEQSPAMVAQLRAKPGGDAIPVTMGDMSEVGTGKRYGLVYLVFNTIGNLLTQDGQVRCFANAARHLADDGVFVLECRVPTAPARAERQFIEVEDFDVDHIAFGVCRYDPLTQILDLNHVRMDATGPRFSPIRLRLAHPPEFDLMARLAGLRLRERWGGWNREPFTAGSWRHISVYSSR
ncbi:class I SAM-dependent DNA methyltransferase [Actinokineospora sp. NPDC004072]